MMKSEERIQLEEFAKHSLFVPETIQGLGQPMVDSAGNLHFIQKNKGEKLQIIFRVSPVGMIPEKETEDGYFVTIVGDGKRDDLKDSLVYDGTTPMGILRRKDEEWLLKSFTDISSLQFKIFTFKNSIFCKDFSLYSNDIISILSLNFADFILHNDTFSDKYIDFTIWNSSLNGENGLLSAYQSCNPDKILFLSVIPDEKNCAFGSGASFVFKDGNYVLPQKRRTQLLDVISQEKLETQFYVGKTDSAMEQLDIHAFGKPLLGIYLPVKHKDTKNEEINWLDVEKTRKVLLKCDRIL